MTFDTTGGSHWKIGIEASLGVTQAAYSDNWVGGESGSIMSTPRFETEGRGRILSASCLDVWCTRRTR